MNKGVMCECMQLLVSLIINGVTCVINCGLPTYSLLVNVNKKNRKKHMLN